MPKFYVELQAKERRIYHITAEDEFQAEEHAEIMYLNGARSYRRNDDRSEFVDIAATPILT
jgi:hypothetical protein